MLFVKLLIDCFFPELNILDHVSDAERPYTSTMAAFDSGTPMNNGRTKGSTSTDDLKSNLWNICTYNQKISFSPITEGQSFFDISRLRAFQSCVLCLSYCLRPNISDGHNSQRPKIMLHKIHEIQLIQWAKRVDSWIQFEELLSVVQEGWLLHSTYRAPVKLIWQTHRYTDTLG